MSSTYIKPDILPILSPNPIQKAQPDLQLWYSKILTYFNDLVISKFLSFSQVI